MPSTSINDCAIHYEVHGTGVPVVLTGGGREGCEESRPLAEALAGKYQVILWDRATIGQSDVQFDGPRDLELWATQLHELLRRLDVGPAYLVGPSNGARVSMVTALRYPAIVKGLFLFLITGGSDRAVRNLSEVFVATHQAIETGGMEAVTELPFWRDRIAANPANRGRLLAMAPAEAQPTMRRWADAFDPSHRIMGLSDDDLRRIKVPARVLDATEPTDLMRRYNRELAERLPNADLIADADFQQEWTELCQRHGLGAGHYTEAPSLARLVDAFVSEREAALACTG
jgi:pimeloyl-ACP methyl ester carboxylesterase